MPGSSSSGREVRDASRGLAQVVPELPRRCAAPGKRPAMPMMAMGSWAPPAGRGRRRDGRRGSTAAAARASPARGECLPAWAARKNSGGRELRRLLAREPATAPAGTSSELPPRSKKLSRRPTRSMPSARANAAQQPALGVAGRRARYGCAQVGPRRIGGAGRARRSSLPFGVIGSAAEHARTRAGTMKSGSTCARCARSSAAGARRRSANDVSDQPRLAGRVRRARPRRRRGPPGARASADSISPSSMRKPRILTWSSTRPDELEVAVGAGSGPGRRCDTGARRGAPNGFGDEPLGGELRPLQIAARQAAPADVQLAHDAWRHRLAATGRARRPCVSSIGRPIGTDGVRRQVARDRVALP